MATVQCERKKHFFDDTKYDRCPYCPVDDVAPPDLKGTQDLKSARSGSTPTEPAFQSTAAAGGGRNPGNPGVTISVPRKSMGIDPVVGWLVCIAGPDKGRDYRLHSDRNKIGRSPNMDVFIEGDDTISRENHAQLVYSARSKTFSVVPGDGRNLIYLNDADVFTPQPLNPYDVIELGQTKLMFIPFCGERFDWAAEDAKQKAEAAAKSGS
ncbi:FHA domain-containing protein [Azospirillum sp. B4]|uniref:FHA domain-containing protein n=1 Tax=Azospirillum sp. B4 TaxID=95605 RepID=UPI0005C826B4|nr:FHA domain-containing protein [Azospirillum sp. B4]